MTDTFSPTPAELIQRPLDVVQARLKQLPATRLTDGDDWDVPAFFIQKLGLGVGTNGLIRQIPSLNDNPSEMLRPNSLVRFRCMVQDVLSQEFYRGVYEIRNASGQTLVRTGKYQDVLLEMPPNPDDFKEMATFGRLVLNCVEIPGESAWVSAACATVATDAKEKEKEKAVERKDSGKKRNRRGGADDDDDAEMSQGSQGSKDKEKESKEGKEKAAEKSKATRADSARASKPKSDSDGSADGFAMATEETEVKNLSVSAPAKSGAQTSTQTFSQTQAGSHTSTAAGSGMDLDDAAGADDDAGREKKVRQDDTAKDERPAHAVHTYKHPGGLQCLVKMYDKYAQESSNYKVGDALEVIGVLVVDPELSEQSLDDEDWDYNPPVSRAVRLHCITLRKLELGHPLVPAVGTPAFVPARELMVKHVAEIRGRLLSYIAAVCGGDNVVAEMLIAHMLSRVHARKHDRPIGKLSLNITNAVASSSASATATTTASPPAAALSSSTAAGPFSTPVRQHTHAPHTHTPSVSFPTLIFELYRALLPAARLIPVTIDSLNTQRLQPIKDLDRNCIVTSPLQTVAGTAIIFDETKMADVFTSTHTRETLVQTGLKNVNAIQQLLHNQTLEYDFQFYQSQFPVDAPVLLLSVAKSFFKPDLSVPLRPTDKFPSALPTVPEDVLDIWRKYLLLLRQVDFTLDEEATKMVSEWFVGERKKNAALTEEALHIRLTLGRLLAVSFGESALSAARWSHVLSLFAKLPAAATSASSAMKE